MKKYLSNILFHITEALRSNAEVKDGKRNQLTLADYRNFTANWLRHAKTRHENAVARANEAAQFQGEETDSTDSSDEDNNEDIN